MRHQLPNRRPNETIETEWGGIPFSVTLGYDPDTCDVCEVFSDVPKGGQMAATLADVCVLISIALQSGLTCADLSKSLARVPDLMRPGETMPASPIGAIMEAINNTH